MAHDGVPQLAALPAKLDQELKRLEDDFWISGGKLKTIIARFKDELQEGLEQHGQNIPMNITWVMGWPTGKERGSYLTLDLGGTNLRVCWVELAGREHEVKITQDQYKLSDEIKQGQAEQLWDHVAESLGKFIQKHDLKGTEEEPIPFGFTFSYPAAQDYIDHGVLQTWTKGLDIKGVEGNDAATQLKEALQKRKLPIRLVALINDTTGAMIASSYNDSKTIAGAIFGTVCNAAYMEDCASISKLKDSKIPQDTKMAINCEYGAFDNSHKVLPRTKYDVQIDEESPRPGEQTFEKLSAGHYMGEIFRLALIDLHNRSVVFQGQDCKKLRQSYLLDTGFLSQVEDDSSPGQETTRDLFKETVNIDLSTGELSLVKRLAEAIAERGARLCCCGIAAICQKKGIKEGHVAADGSVANKHPKFKARWAQAMGEVFDWPADRKEDPIIITSAEDGSGIGAAIIAAMTDERARKGNLIGIKNEQTRRLSKANL